LNAIEDFFPDTDVLDTERQSSRDDAIDEEQRQIQYIEGGGSLRRVDTGISSIVGRDNGDRPGGFVLVIDGAGLSEALGDDEEKALLLKLAMLCEGVICCRVSPLQKALMVMLIRDGIHAMTLAIGDGANDVSMIQASCDPT
jgi:phospholipid-translocating ATPase